MNEKAYRLPLILAALVFSLSVIGLWVSYREQLNTSMALIGGGYAVLCFFFLLFQIFTFIKAHVDYDEDIELVKYDVFKAEEEEWGKL